MQNIVSKLQDIIKTHYGYASRLELKPVASYQSLQRELYSTVDRCLSIPLLDPKSRQPVAYFKILDVAENSGDLHERLGDLVHVTLQSYVDLIDQLDVSESLVQYLNLEMNPQNIIRLHDRLKNTTPMTMPRPRAMGEPGDVNRRNSELLILSPSLSALDRLAFAIHETSRNPFFIRTDHMPDSFMKSINDLTGLHETTLYIPRLQRLTSIQQKTLETYFILSAGKARSLLVICGTRSSLSRMTGDENVSPGLLEHLHFFHVLSQGNDEAPIKFETLSQCALSILGLDSHAGADSARLIQKTKSYHVIPSLNDLYPTIH